MACIILRLDPLLLENPDADIRYELPKLLKERSDRNIGNGDGYDYVGDAPYMLLFLAVREMSSKRLACIVEVIENVRFDDNDLRKGIVVVAIEREGKHEVVYPTDFKGSFLPAEK